MGQPLPSTLERRSAFVVTVPRIAAHVAGSFDRLLLLAANAAVLPPPGGGQQGPTVFRGL
jgi:hypothetical protein